MYPFYVTVCVFSHFLFFLTSFWFRTCFSYRHAPCGLLTRFLDKTYRETLALLWVRGAHTFEVLMCIIYIIENGVVRGFRCSWTETVSTELPHHHPLPFVRVIWFAAGGATVWHKHTALCRDSRSVQKATQGIWKLSLGFFFSWASHVLTLCLSKQSIKWFYTQGLLWTHTVYREVWACYRQATLLMLGKEMTTPSQGAGKLTGQGRESGLGFSSKTVITLLLWTLIWTCGSSLTLYYNSMVTWGLTVEATWISPYFDNSSTHYNIYCWVHSLTLERSAPWFLLHCRRVA